MKNTSQITNAVSPHHLLNHPFYQAWTCGDLPPERIALYARQYLKHVKAFPRYLSLMHSGCEDIKVRQLLLENLIDEERGSENHPELWMRFAESWGQSRTAIEAEQILPETQNLIDTFFELARQSVPAALGALYAYEHQVPAVADFKIRALKEHYPQCDTRGREFFEVHRQADVWHSEALSRILEGFTDEQAAEAQAAAVKASKALWSFLDGVTQAPLLAA